MRQDLKIEWPDINYGELKTYDVENIAARIMYKSILALIFIPEIVLRSFWEVFHYKL